MLQANYVDNFHKKRPSKLFEFVHQLVNFDIQMERQLKTYGEYFLGFYNALGKEVQEKLIGF